MRKVIISLLAAAMLTACTTSFQTLPMDEFEAAIAQPNVTVVDVRTPQEYAEGHIGGAVNIDWKAGHFAEEAAEQLSKDKTIAVYCIHARRSKFAAEELVKLHYKVIELQDGLEAWINAGKPIEK
jgi:rhodanese-related sulfurtransferase